MNGYIGTRRSGWGAPRKVCSRCGAPACASGEWRCKFPGPVITREEYDRQSEQGRADRSQP